MFGFFRLWSASNLKTFIHEPETNHRIVAPSDYLRTLRTGNHAIGGGFFTAQAQNTVKGNVTDPSGAPLVGATVIIVEDNTKGTFTNADGDFEINVPQGNSLQISSIGYKTSTVKIGSQTNLKIVLAEDLNQLEDVVVIGYGTARKGDLTGSISSVSGSNLTKRSSQQITSALQGQIAGLQVTRSSGGPGDSGSIRIRGVTTMSTNDPLIIVDGVPTSTLNDVLASDVETMTVLKDAASAAIYGSRAAAGVILITTKRARSNEFSLDYNYEFALDTPTTRPTNGDAIDWLNIQNEIKWNDGASDPYSMYSQEYINSYMENNATDPYHYANTDWVDLMLKKTTSHQQHSLSVTGGTDKLRSKFTFNYQNGKGYYDNRGYERYAGRVNNDYKITDWMRFNLDFNFSASQSKSPALGNAIYWAYLMAPIYAPYWENGQYADVKDGANGLAGLKEGGISRTNYYKFGGKAQLDITPVKGLTLTAVFSPRYSITKGKSFKKAVNVYYEDGRSVLMQSLKTTNLSESRNDSNNMTYQFYANYGNKWGDHSFSAMVGYEGYKYEWENLGASRTNYLLDRYPYLNLGPEDYQYNSGSAGHNAYQSVFGRLMYSYRNKYMIQANIRTDGSSRFHKDCRWGTFPSVSAGWVISEEPWFKNDVLQYLKLRGSIGQLGNERIGSEFPYMAAISFGNSYMYDKGSQTVSAVQNAAQVYYAFQDITWETTTTYNIGLDYGFFNDRLFGTLDFYYRETTDLLNYTPIAAGANLTNYLFANIGSLVNKGVEFEITGVPVQTSDWYWSIGANVAYNQNRITKLTTNDGEGYTGVPTGGISGGVGNTIQRHMTGYPAKTFYVYQQVYDENGAPIPGAYVDQNGDGVIDADDLYYLGQADPVWTIGMDYRFQHLGVLEEPDPGHCRSRQPRQHGLQQQCLPSVPALRPVDQLLRPQLYDRCSLMGLYQCGISL